MLKNRQEGLVSLQGFFVTLAAGVLYYAWSLLVQSTGLITFPEDTEVLLYCLGSSGGALLSTRVYRTLQSRLGYLNWMELAQLTQRQIVRIALVIFAIAFATKDLHISRLFLASYLVVAAVMITLLNCFLPSLLGKFFFTESAMPTLFVGAPSDIRKLQNWIKHKAHLGVQPVGFVSNEADSESIGPWSYCGKVTELDRIISTQNIGQIILHQFYLSRDEANEIIAIAQRHACRVRLYSDLNAYYEHPVAVDQEGDYTFFTLHDEPLQNPVNRVMKRAFDIAVALPVVLFVLPPLTITVWIMQSIQSCGPIFYPQLRSGINKRRFHIWKFRTMNVASQTKEQAVVQAKQGDSRIYSFGRFMRRTSMDEIPQFLNVLLGEMSVSGPRPHMIEHDEQFSRILRSYHSRHYVKPGITGLAQSKGFRGEISEVALLEKRIGYDLHYINKWSIFLDIKILFATAWQVIFPPKTAY